MWRWGHRHECRGCPCVGLGQLDGLAVLIVAGDGRSLGADGEFFGGVAQERKERKGHGEEDSFHES